MKKLFITLTLICFVSLHAQKWIDTSYTFTKTTANYGQAIDFAGNNVTLTMDICVPNNDVPPKCGRPLLIAIHGGAFMAGSKEDYDIQRWMKDYAKRGYVTAAINYRLGMFQTSNSAHCNVTQLFSTPWDCSNMADTAEWYRGCYRGIQDTRAAIRYLLTKEVDYKISRLNVFLVGESAGGFIALGTGFLDSASEKSVTCGAIASVSAPNAIYENACVKQFNWDTSIASMRLTRPDLGSYQDTQSYYTIKGIGNFFGGMFPGWLDHTTPYIKPSIYMYHQPNDIIVPYRTNKVLKGYSDCFTGLGCASLISNPWLHGSAGVRNQIERLKKLSKYVPDYYFDSTTNNADCAQQALNPALTGHAIDNYWLRSLHMAQYFAPLVDTSTNCNIGITKIKDLNKNISISPNPFQTIVTIHSENALNKIEVMDITGRIVNCQVDSVSAFQWEIAFGGELKAGIYFLQIKGNNGEMIGKKIVKI